MTRKKKTAILFLILLGVALLPLLFLKAWAAYKLGEVNAQQPAQGTLISQENTSPEGKNLYEHPLWGDFLKESYARSMMLEEGMILEEGKIILEDLPPATNALSRWCDEQSEKSAYYQDFKPQVEKHVVPRPGNFDSTQRELLPTFETLQKGLKRVHDKAVPPGLRPMVEKYLEREDLSDEEKVLAVFQEYFQSGDPATEAEIKKSLAESSYLGISDEMYTKLGVTEGEAILSPVDALAFLKTVARHYGYKARWDAYSGQREKTLEDLQPVLDLAGIEGHNSTLIEGLVRIAIRSMAAATVHSIIRENVLNEEDLLSIQTRFSQMDIMKDLRQTLEGEELYFKEMSRFQPNLPSMKGFWQRSFIRLVRFSGYMDLNEAAVFKAMRDLQATIDTEGQTLDYTAWKKVTDMPKSIFNVLARQTIPAVGKASNRFLRIQSERDAVILGCALERYRMKEGSFPEALEALIPEYLPQMPPGSLSQGNLSYTRTEKGYELILNKLPELPADARMETIWRR